MSDFIIDVQTVPIITQAKSIVLKCYKLSIIYLLVSYQWRKKQPPLDERRFIFMFYSYEISYNPIERGCRNCSASRLAVADWWAAD
jgi:hypothetical protein